jgi:hypothetical protein
MMEAASTSETSVNLYQTTRRNNPEDSHLQLTDQKKKKNQKLFPKLTKNNSMEQSPSWEAKSTLS